MNNITSKEVETLESSELVRAAIQCFLLAVLFVLGALLNVSIIWLIRTHQSLQTITNLWVLSLCIAQLLIVVFMIPFALLTTAIGDWIFGKLFCQLFAYLTFIVRTVSIYSVAAIALHRYHAVSRPFSKRIKKKKAKILIAFTWWAAGVICFLPLVGIGSFRYSPTHHLCHVSWSLGGSALVYTSFYISAVFLATSITSFWSYALIYKITKLHAKKKKKATTIKRSQSDNHLSIRQHYLQLQQSTVTKRSNIASLSPPQSTCEQPSKQSPKSHRTLDQKTMQTILFILVEFMIAWTPYFLHALFLASNGYITFPLSSPRQWTGFFVTWLSLCTCICDPILYGFYTRNFRGYIRKQFFCWNYFRKVKSSTEEDQKSSRSTTKNDFSNRFNSTREASLAETNTKKVDSFYSNTKSKQSIPTGKNHHIVVNKQTNEGEKCVTANKTGTTRQHSITNAGFVEEETTHCTAEKSLSIETGLRISNFKKSYESFNHAQENPTRLANQSPKRCDLKSVAVLSDLSLLSAKRQSSQNNQHRLPCSWNTNFQGVSYLL